MFPSHALMKTLVRTHSKQIIREPTHCMEHRISQPLSVAHMSVEIAVKIASHAAAGRALSVC